jgi:NAD+ diphosphatase
METTHLLKESIYKRYIPGIIPETSEPEKKWWFIFNSGKLLIENTDGKAAIPFLKSPAEIGISTKLDHYLGTLGGYGCYTAVADTEASDREIIGFRELRSLFCVLDDDILMLACRAKQLAEWNRLNQFCGRCGSHTEPKKDERAHICPKCGLIVYPRISPAVITAIIKGDSILLAHNYRFRNNMYSLIAGFVEAGETLEDTVKREIFEEVGLKVRNIRYFSSQPWPFPDSLMVGFTAEYESGDINVDGIEIRDAAWFKSSSLPDLPDGMSIARKIIEWFKENY